MAEDELIALKKKLLLVAFFLRMLFSGIEYSIIFPSALPYMKSLHGSHVLMGIVIAVYPFAAMLSLPVFGYIYDKTNRLKELMLLLNAFQIIGNIIYSLPYSTALPIIGRFLGGLGDGFIACATGEITFLYTKSARIGILSLMELGRVFGLIIGPVMNIFIGKHSYMFHDWLLDYTTLPGVIMACAWCFMQLVTICCVNNIAQVLEKKKDNEECSVLLNSESEDSQTRLNRQAMDESLIYTDDFDEGSRKLLDSLGKSNTPERSQKRDYWQLLFKACFSLEFLVIFYVDLILWLIQTQFEILMPYITEIDYGWSPSLSSVIYVIGGVVLLVIFLLMYLLSTKYPIHDAHLLLFSLILTQISVGLVICESIPTEKYQKIIIFSVICALVFTAIPFNLVCSRNLFTRLFPAEHQGIIQGLYSSASRVSMITGPVLISLVFERRQLYGAVASILVSTAIIFLVASMNRIKESEKNSQEELSQ